jgi:hypothetical protein
MSKRECRLIEDDMAGDDDVVGGEIKAPVAFVIGGIAKECT